MDRITYRRLLYTKSKWKLFLIYYGSDVEKKFRSRDQERHKPTKFLWPQDITSMRIWVSFGALSFNFIKQKKFEKCFRDLFEIKHTEFVFILSYFACHKLLFQKLASAFLQQIWLEQNSCFTTFFLFFFCVVYRIHENIDYLETH